MVSIFTTVIFFGVYFYLENKEHREKVEELVQVNKELKDRISRLEGQIDVINSNMVLFVEKNPGLTSYRLEMLEDQMDVRFMLDAINRTKDTEVKIIETGHGAIMISLPESILFQSGEARVRSEALPLLKALSDVLIEMGRHIRILGHTDNVPIRTAQFPSNWELSAVRAVMVVRIFSELYEVPITHLSATGFADSKPVATNDTPEGRTKNRRVEIIVLENHASEETLDALLPKDGASAPFP